MPDSSQFTSFIRGGVDTNFKVSVAQSGPKSNSVAAAMQFSVVKKGALFKTVSDTTTTTPPVQFPSLSPLSFFGNNGFINSDCIVYADNKWAIGGADGSFSGYNVWYGSILSDDKVTGLSYLSIFGSQGLVSVVKYINGVWIIGGISYDDLFADYNGLNLRYGSDFTNNLTMSNVSIFGNEGRMYSVDYDSTTGYVVGGGDKSGSGLNIYYGKNLSNLTSMELFGDGGKATVVKKIGSTWVIGGHNMDNANLGKNLYYGDALDNLTALSIFGNGGTVYNITYANGLWIIGGHNNELANVGKNLYYGPSLSSLTPLSIFGTGRVFSIVYAKGLWIIGGENGDNSGNNVYYGSLLTNLTPLLLFGGGGAVYNVTYTNNKLLFGGYNNYLVGENLYYGDF